MANSPVFVVGQGFRPKTTFTVDGVPTNPTTVTLTVTKPDGTTLTPALTNVGPGVYQAASAIEADQDGRWFWYWDGDGVAEGADFGELWVQPAGRPGLNLITLDQLKDALGWSVDDDTRDAQLYQAILDAAVAIRTYTERYVGAPAVTETRSYRYDGHGWLNIDDATAITSVTLDGTALIADTEYLLGPDRPMTPDAPLVYEWIELTPYVGTSPAMGFERNLDTLWWKYPRRVYTIQVTGTFGWNGFVPYDVQRAAIYTAMEFSNRVSPYVSESIDSYSHSSENPIRNAIPDRAKELLHSYRRFY